MLVSKSAFISNIYRLVLLSGQSRIGLRFFSRVVFRWNSGTSNILIQARGDVAYCIADFLLKIDHSEILSHLVIYSYKRQY